MTLIKTMTKFSFGKIDFDLSPGTARTATSRDPESPFCLLLLGDVSGRANRGLLEPIGQRRPWQIDCDNFDEVMARIGVALRLPDPLQTGEMIELRFRTLQDFHPDALIQQG